MGSVFISHARRDRQVARSVADRLREHGHEAYVDDGPAAGLDWWRQTLAHIEEAELFLALTSPAYDGSEACRLEAAHAASVGLEVLAVPITADAAARAEDVLDPREPDEPPPPEPVEVEEEPDEEPDEEPVEEAPVPRRDRLEETAVAAVLLVVLLVVVVLVVVRTGGGDQPRSPGPGAATAQEQVDALRAQVEAADGGDPTAPLPAASCGARDGAQLICRRPAPNVQSVTLRTYDDAELLQDAYLRQVQRLSGDSYRANAGPCDGSVAEGEEGWSDPDVPGAQGRAFCVVSSQVMQLVWTQGDHVLGLVTGQPAPIVATWWASARARLAAAATG